MYQNLIRNIENLVIVEFLETKRFNVSFWENHNNWETFSEMGTTKTQTVSHAKDELDKAKGTSFEYIQGNHKGDFRLCLRAAMRKLYIEAQDFTENPRIKIPNLKKIILMREMLNQSDESLTIYSTKYLINI